MLKYEIMHVFLYRIKIVINKKTVYDVSPWNYLLIKHPHDISFHYRMHIYVPIFLILLL